MAFKPAPVLKALSKKGRKSGLSVEPRTPHHTIVDRGPGGDRFGAIEDEERFEHGGIIAPMIGVAV